MFKAAVFAALVVLAICGHVQAQTLKGQLVSATLVQSFTIDQLRAAKPLQVEALRVQYNSVVYNITYSTSNFYGQTVNATGLVGYSTNCPFKQANYLWYRGTEINRYYRQPNNFAYTKTEAVYYLAAGCATFAWVDYLGYEGSSAFPPYIISNVTAINGLDMLRATRTFLHQQGIRRSKQLFLGGYSQGGHAVVATQKLIDSSSSFRQEFKYTYVYAGGGPYAISLMIQAVLPSNLSFTSPALAMFLIHTYSLYYNLYNPLYNPTWAPVLDGQVFAGDRLSVDQANPLLNKYPLNMLSDDAVTDIKTHPTTSKIVTAALQNNLLGGWNITGPLFIYHAVTDDVVPLITSQLLYNGLKAYNANNQVILQTGTAPTHYAGYYEFFHMWATHAKNLQTYRPIHHHNGWNDDDDDDK